jgi:hypothetical protein
MIWISKPIVNNDVIMCSPHACTSQYICTTNNCPPDIAMCMGIYIAAGEECPPAFCDPWGACLTLCSVLEYE